MEIAPHPGGACKALCPALHGHAAPLILCPAKPGLIALLWFQGQAESGDVRILFHATQEPPRLQQSNATCSARLAQMSELRINWGAGPGAKMPTPINHIKPRGGRVGSARVGEWCSVTLREGPGRMGPSSLRLARQLWMGNPAGKGPGRSSSR